MSFDDNKEVKVDEAKLDVIQKKIFIREKQNLINHTKSDETMKKEIEAIIEEEVGKCF